MPDDRLESWKEIAAYLGRQVRTVQGWEKSLGLPVHRLQHQKSGSVYAFKEELEAWRAEREPAADPDQPPAVRRSRRGIWALGAGCVVVAAIVLTWLQWRPAPATAPESLATRYFAASQAAGAKLRMLPGPPDVNQLMLSPDGGELIAANSAGLVEAIAPGSGAVVREWRVPPPLASLAISPDGHRLYTLSGNSLISVLSRSSGAVARQQLEAAANSMVLSPDGRALYVALPFTGVDKLATASLQMQHWTLPACPEDLAMAPDGQRVFVSFQCDGPGGSPGHDAIAVLDSRTGAMQQQFAGPPRVGTPLMVSPDGSEIWSNSDAGCVSPQFDHRGCPFVPASLLQVFASTPLHLLHTVAIPAGIEPNFGPITFLPGGERVLDGDYLLSTTRYARLEALPAGYTTAGLAAATPDGAHLYVPVRHAGTTGIADFTPTPPACSPPTLGLVNWWTGDGSGDDAWGVVNAQPSAEVAYGPGKAGEAFDLTRPGAYLTLGPDPSLNFRAESH